MSLLLLFRPSTASVEPPAPAPVAPVRVPAGAHRIPRVAVRIAGRMYVGDYREIARLVASLAEQDAAQAAVESPVPVARTSREVKRGARKAAAEFSALMQVMDVVVPGPLLTIDPAPVAQRDLRAEYLRAYAAAVLATERAAQARAMEAQRLADEEAALRAWMEQDEADANEAIARILELL